MSFSTTRLSTASATLYWMLLNVTSGVAGPDWGAYCTFCWSLTPTLKKP